MSEPQARDVDALFDRLLIGDDPALTAVHEATAAGMRPIEVSPQYGKFLYLLASAMQARRILEIGTLGGFSTIWLARAVGPSGHVVTLEREPKHADVARANLDEGRRRRTCRSDRRRGPGHAPAIGDAAGA